MEEDPNSESGKERVLKLFLEIGVAERHFNDLQATYRRLSSAWLLAVVSAIGFVLTKNLSLTFDNLTLDSSDLVVAVLLLGLIGNLLLWSLDTLLYHRLLDSHFLQGLEFERRYHWLPPIRHTMIALRTKGMGKVVAFYLIPAGLMLVVLLVVTANSFAHNNAAVRTEFVIVGVFLTTATFLGLYRLSMRPGEYFRKRLQWLDDLQHGPLGPSGRRLRPPGFEDQDP